MEPEVQRESAQEADLCEGAWAVAAVFTRLGLTAFGGPAAHVSLMEDEFVSRRRWLSREEFLDLLGATNLIPGPNSTEMAIHIGYRRAGWRGFLIGGACFILPAALLVTVLSWIYTRYGSLPQAEGLLHGIKPVIMVIILQALWRMAGAALKTRALVVVAAGSAVLNALGVHELAVLAMAGATAIIESRGSARTSILGVFPMGLPYAATALPASAAPFSLPALFVFFVKVGSVLFGGGYVLLAFLRADLVERWGWLTEAQLLDAIAVGQITPGPLFTSATFIGYLLAGPWGALVATIGIFLPAFVFVALSIPLLPRLRKSPTFAAALDGINAGALALMAVVSWRLGSSSLTDLPSLVICAVAAALLLAYRVNTTWLVLGGGILGLLFFR